MGGSQGLNAGSGAKRFALHALWVFFALRLADAVNVAAGMWFVPKYVSPEEIGAVLPLATFATFLSLPLFAFAMTAMKESAHLHAAGDRALLASLLKGVFTVAGVFALAGLAVAALLLPRFLSAVGVSEAGAGFMVVAAAFLGCVGPVYTDALQATKRFRALGAVEILSSLARFGTMVFSMPIKALSGYFAGQAVQPLCRIAVSLCLLRGELGVKGGNYWNHETFRRFFRAFVMILVYQALPMGIALLEQYVIRTSMTPGDSAGYYMVSRFSDFLYYLTLPLILVSFPYTAVSSCAEERMKYVWTCSGVTLGVAAVAAAVYAARGEVLLSLMPNGSGYADYAFLMPHLVLIAAFSSVQVFFTNAEVSVGRFGFFRWFVPLHLVYAGALWYAARSGGVSAPSDMLIWFWFLSMSRGAFSLLCIPRCTK